ncbi:MAG: hypothetical protein KGH75_04910 [Rhodospirillales bacterium]|nr:hypothetical protein [Rhodospirillales bacterium]
MQNDYKRQEVSLPTMTLVVFLAVILGASIALVGFFAGAHIAAEGGIRESLVPTADPQNAVSITSSDACGPGKQVFSFTGAPQIVSVPAGCTAAIIQAVGAGGGGFAGSNQTGGTGGFVSARFNLAGISQLIVVVGQGGIGSCLGDCSGDNVPSVFGGGGATLEGNGGGGYSGVFKQSLEQSLALVIAGGGGGGGGGSGGSGGSGGGLAGTLGSNPGSGGGGTQLAGGSAASEDDGYSGNIPGAALAGGRGAYGGGGGGGYFGGGGGGRQGFWIHAGGGGGAGFVANSALNPAVNLAGGEKGISKDADAAWGTGAGAGGTSGNGGNGMVTITWVRQKSWYNPF